MHPRSFHSAWPLAREKALIQLSTHFADAVVAGRSLSSKISRNDPSHPALACLKRLCEGRSLPRSARQEARGTWLVFPFHPCWQRLKNEVNEIVIAWEVSANIPELGYLLSLRPRISVDEHREGGRVICFLCPTLVIQFSEIEQ